MLVKMCIFAIICAFNRKRVQYCGHLYTVCTVHPNKTKVVKFGASTRKQELTPIDLKLNNKDLKL